MCTGVSFTLPKVQEEHHGFRVPPKHSCTQKALTPQSLAVECPASKSQLITKDILPPHQLLSLCIGAPFSSDIAFPEH